MDKELVKAVATLLCQKAATETDFFFAVAQLMEKKGYKLVAEQKGVFGTVLSVQKM